MQLLHSIFFWPGLKRVEIIYTPFPATAAPFSATPSTRSTRHPPAYRFPPHAAGHHATPGAHPAPHPAAPYRPRRSPPRPAPPGIATICTISAPRYGKAATKVTMPPCYRSFPVTIGSLNKCYAHFAAVERSTCPAPRLALCRRSRPAQDSSRKLPNTHKCSPILSFSASRACVSLPLS